MADAQPSCWRNCEGPPDTGIRSSSLDHIELCRTLLKRKRRSASDFGCGENPLSHFLPVLRIHRQGGPYVGFPGKQAPDPAGGTMPIALYRVLTHVASATRCLGKSVRLACGFFLICLIGATQATAQSCPAP